MTVARRTLAFFAAAMLIAPVAASACSISPKAVKRYPKAAAAQGYLVRARVVRGYDAVNRLPEQLEIEKVFVGGDIPRLVALDRDKAFFDEHVPPPPGVIKSFAFSCSIEYPQPVPKAELMILYPARSETGAVVPGVFRLYFFNTFPSPGRKLDIMLDQAKRHGRLRERPQSVDFSLE